jgi:hypothetical protein
MPADWTGIELLDGVRAEFPIDLAADFVQVDTEGGQQRALVVPGAVTAPCADDAVDRLSGAVGRDPALAEQFRGAGQVRSGEGDEKVFDADVPVLYAFGFGARGGKERPERSSECRSGS